MSYKKWSFFNQAQSAGDNSIQFQAGRDIHLHGNFKNDLLKNTIRQVCSKQLTRFMLRDSRILQNKTDRLSDLYASHRIEGKTNDFFLTISDGFLGFDKALTSIQQELDVSIIKTYCEKNNGEIEVTTCSWFVGALSILSYMKESLSIPLNINLDFAHSGQTAIDLKSQKSDTYPQISILADGPSSLILERYDKEPKYIPASFAPPLEHRVVINKRAKKWYTNNQGLSGEYHIVNYENLISTPRLHLNYLIEQKKVNPRKTKVVCVEPGGQLPVFLDGASDTRSIFCDPQWQVINLWHPGSFNLYNKESYWSDVIIHIEKEFHSDIVCDSFLRLFHGCWYDMKYNLNSSLDKAVNSLLCNNDFNRLLLHFCGLK